MPRKCKLCKSNLNLRYNGFPEFAVCDECFKRLEHASVGNPTIGIVYEIGKIIKEQKEGKKC